MHLLVSGERENFFKGGEMKKVIVCLAVAVLLLGLSGVAMAAYTITDDATGGDCAQIGTWDAGTKTCTLTGDLTNQPDGLVIASDYITLDGNGYTLSGLGASGIGLSLTGRNGLIIKNLNVQYFSTGVALNGCNGSTFSDSTVSHNSDNGVFLLYFSNNNLITRNNISYNGLNGIDFLYSSTNMIYNNNIANNNVGTHFYNSQGNLVFSNNIQHSLTGGQLGSSETPNSCNIYSLALPIGGNYWRDCDDENGDGFCDAPHYIQSWPCVSADYYARTAPIIWVDEDNDSYYTPDDCNDNAATIYPGAPEVKHDGIDQDCNGYDLTINIVTATYKASSDTLNVEATSALGSSANLQLVGYGPMTWKASQMKWVITVKPAGGNPGTVTVSGVEGAETQVVLTQ